MLSTIQAYNCSWFQSPLDEPVVLTDEVIFPLTVSLDKLPVSTLKVKVRELLLFHVLFVFRFEFQLLFVEMAAK